MIGLLMCFTVLYVKLGNSFLLSILLMSASGILHSFVPTVFQDLLWVCYYSYPYINYFYSILSDLFVLFFLYRLCTWIFYIYMRIIIMGTIYFMVSLDSAMSRLKISNLLLKLMLISLAGLGTCATALSLWVFYLFADSLI